MPVHVPFVVLSVDPSTGDPEMSGSAVFTGADGSVTTAVCAESALAEPSAFEAVSRRIQTFLRPAITNVPAAAIEGETAEDDEIPDHVDATTGHAPA